MRCFGRARFTGTGARPLLASFLRADGLAAVLAALRATDLRAGDFFCAVLRLAARAVFFVGFFSAIDVLPFPGSERLARIAPRRFVQCSRNTPSTARNSAGFINFECATVTENSGPSSLSCQNARK